MWEVKDPDGKSGMNQITTDTNRETYEDPN